MRLCYVAPLSSVHTQRWVRFFAERGHEIHVVTPVGSSVTCPPNVSLHPVPAVRTGQRGRDLVLNALLTVSRIRRFRRIFGQINPDVVHAHYLNEAALFAVLAGFHPVVATAWGSDVLIGPRESRMLRWMVRMIVRRADLITCDARHLKRALVDLGADPAKIELVFFGTDVTRFSGQAATPAFRERLGLDDAPVVISLRSLEPLYDVSTLIAAVPIVLRGFPRAMFVVAGAGSEEMKLRAAAERLGVADQIRFVGMLTEEELPASLAASDIYVSTALSDGGLAASTAEAMASELPVVITDVADNRAWVVDGVTGIIVPPRDPAALADRLIRLIQNPEERRRLGLRARGVIEERNNWHREMARMETLYHGLVRTDGG